MKLLIHFGIYKTGSSYLQYLCANNRAHLVERGIYFPPSKEDKKMLEGLISKGNAGNLEYLLFHQQRKAVEQQFEAWRKKAEEQKCDKVLISAEALVHQLALKAPLDVLVEVAQSAGFQEIRAIGFFRDLVDHAISTYKHRAKSGRHPDLKGWIENTYETPVLLQRLLNRLDEHPNIQFTLRSFRKDGGWMKQAFFEDWLSVKLPDFTSKAAVNTSLSLSEIKVLQGLKVVFPRTLDILVRRLQTLPSAQKAKDKSLENYTRAIFYEHLKQHQNLLNQLSLYFKEGENIHLGNPHSYDLLEEKPIAQLQLSPEQWVAIQEGIAFLSSSKGLKIRLRRKLGLLIKFSKMILATNKQVSISLNMLYPKKTNSGFTDSLSIKKQ